ncbi:MAG: phosphoribosylamine--glycine ligase [Acetobacteraceae bacterium]
MRILGIGSKIELGDLYLSLLREGHEVRVHAGDPSYAGCFGGFLDRVEEWRSALSWVGREGIVLFERVGVGAQQDALRTEGYQVIGGSALGDRLEYDRGFGQSVLREAGLLTAAARSFGSAGEAASWLGANPGRTVLKYHNNARATFVGDHPAGLDVQFQLRRGPQGAVLLMPRLAGVEVGVGAYFDGQHFLRPACIDFEHKRFFPGEMGEMTGEMGTLVAYPEHNAIFEATLGRLEAPFRAAGHVGYVNLNMIANEDGLWPLEFTCRFGNPGFAILAPLQTEGWGDLFGRMLAGGAERFPTSPDWSVGIVLTVPSFPAELPGAEPSEDPPLFYLQEPGRDEVPHYHLSDVRLEAGQLFARRRTGYAMVVTGTGASVPAAQAAATARARNVIAPDLRWRIDIGDRFLAGEGERLRRLGWL